MLHHFDKDTFLGDLPQQFTYPFCYEPHRLIRHIATQMIADYHAILTSNGSGKMMGVLIVKDTSGQIGYLKAYSGEMPEAVGFVPPIVDYLSPNGYFKTHENEITGINKRIESIENSPERIASIRLAKDTERISEELAMQMKEQIKAHKAIRDQRRAEGNITPDEEQKMIRESQFEKAELKRLQAQNKEKIAQANIRAEQFGQELEILKNTRRQKSNALQEWLFDQYSLLNAQGITRRLDKIFNDAGLDTPPSGAGDCCAPRLLQYAYNHHLTPITMGEFWVGPTPENTLRTEGVFYPACQRKCRPILAHQLKGLNVEANPMEAIHPEGINIVYEDNWLIIVNKPSGLQSVPGLTQTDSVITRLQSAYHENIEIRPVHRLDQMTSGLLVVAKKRDIQAAMQRLFEQRQVKKRYVALLEKRPRYNSGTIELPIGYDPEDTVRRAVDKKNGKPAITKYRIIGTHNNHTLIEYFPQTGRTHQLRIHSAHPEGLDSPIVGDGLYGTRGPKMYLCACGIQFSHPMTGDIIKIDLAEDDLFA